MTTRAFFFFFICIATAFAQPVVVGAVVSETGMQAPLAADYRKALLLWQDEVNAAGGLLGRPVELRLLDDASQAVRAGTLYAELIRDKADLLIGPFGSAATLLALARAERSRRVLINGAAPASAVHRRSPKYVFQVIAPYSAYATGILELARAAGCGQLFISVRDDPASNEMADGARRLALAQGFSVNISESYPGGTKDFAPLVAKARLSGAPLWISFGEARDVAEIVLTSRKEKYSPKVFFTDAATLPNFIPLAGQDAELSLGTVEYDARLATKSNGDFVKAFTIKWSAMPGPAAAAGYAAATVLAGGVQRARSLDQNRLRAALADLEIETVLGRYRVNPANGEQTGIKPAVVQIVKGRPEIVWPIAHRTSEAKLQCR